MFEEYSGIVKDNTSQSRKTRSLTIRLNSVVIDELQTEADNRQMPLSVLINQILKRYVEWDRYQNRIGLMPVPRAILSNLTDKAISIAESRGVKDIDLYRDELIKQASELAFSLIKDSVLFMKKHYNLEVVLSVLEEYMNVSGIKADHKVEGPRKHVFIIQHEMGKNWSLFTKELLALIFENLANAKAEIDMTPNTTIAEVVLR
jgi:macrodomain Ter protein organizer (MatP/YcbG family)